MYRPRILPIPGIDLDNVCQLRNPAEANKIGKDAAGKNVVILGSSFIGRFMWLLVYICNRVKFTKNNILKQYISY